jgi:indole-3-glycerol phosphate synthase
MTILDNIIAHKKEEVERIKELIPQKQLEQGKLFDRTCFSATEFIRRSDKSGIIAEFKRNSPSKGAINENATVKDVTTGYISAGASCLSVLTDQRFFGGSNSDLKEARSLNDAPILRKDFIIDEYQIIEAKSIGADFILLIAECLTAKEIKNLATLARSLGMEVLMELNHDEEIAKICPELHLIGINNRDLTTFKVDMNRSIELARQIPNDFLKVSESGINNADDITFLKEHGFEAFLMGEAFMKTANPGKACKAFIDAACLIN